MQLIGGDFDYCRLFVFRASEVAMLPVVASNVERFVVSKVGALLASRSRPYVAEGWRVQSADWICAAEALIGNVPLVGGC